MIQLSKTDIKNYKFWCKTIDATRASVIPLKKENDRRK